MRAAIAQGLHGTGGEYDSLRCAVWIATLAAGLWTGGAAVGDSQEVAPDRPSNRTSATAPATQVTISNQRRFALPFSDPRRNEITAVQLLLSADRGASWKAYDQQPPTAGQFVFQAPQDGEYWFSSRLINRQDRAIASGPPRAERRVIIDTQEPQLTLTVQAGAAGELLTSWDASDPHLDPQSLKLEYRPDQGGTWQAVEVPKETDGAKRTKLAGELTWWAKTQAQELTVRAEIADRAGNRAVAHRQIVLPKIASRRAFDQQYRVSNPDHGNPYARVGQPGVGATTWNAGGPATESGDARQQIADAGADGPESAKVPRPSPSASFTAGGSGPPASAEHVRQDELPPPRDNRPPGARSNPPPSASDRSPSSHSTPNRLPGVPPYQPANSSPQPPVGEAVRQSLRGLEELPGQPPEVSPSQADNPETSSSPSNNSPSNNSPSNSSTSQDRRNSRTVPAQPAVTNRSQLDTSAHSRSTTDSNSTGSSSSSSSAAAPDRVAPSTPDSSTPDSSTPDSSTPDSSTPDSGAAGPALDAQHLPPGEQPHMSRAKRFNLDYDIDAVDRHDVAAVELWATIDGGRTWAKWGSDPDRQSPFDVQVDEDGYYGFRVVIVARNGLASTVPQAGDLADLWVGVDTQKPRAKFTSVTYGKDEKVGHLMIEWKAEDAVPAERPIGLAFAATKDGPWTTMAAGLPDTGFYLWRADPDLPREIYLRLEVKDRAGNRIQTVLEHPIRVEGLRPKAKIHAIRPVDG